MLTSLKALLFSSVPMPAMDGTPTPVATEGLDFAAMLDAGVADASTAPVDVAPPSADPVDILPVGDDPDPATRQTPADQPSTAERLIGAQALGTHASAPALHAPDAGTGAEPAAGGSSPAMIEADAFLAVADQPTAANPDQPFEASLPRRAALAESPKTVVAATSDLPGPPLPLAGDARAVSAPETADSPRTDEEPIMPQARPAEVAAARPAPVQTRSADTAPPSATDSSADVSPQVDQAAGSAPIAPAPAIAQDMASTPAPVLPAVAPDASVLPPRPEATAPVARKPASSLPLLDTPVFADEAAMTDITPETDDDPASEDIVASCVPADPIAAILSPAMPIAPVTPSTADAAPASTGAPVPAARPRSADTATPAPAQAMPTADAPAPMAEATPIARSVDAVRLSPTLAGPTPLATADAPAPAQARPIAGVTSPVAEATSNAESIDAARPSPTPADTTPSAMPVATAPAPRLASPAPVAPPVPSPVAQTDPALSVDAVPAAPVVSGGTTIVPAPAGPVPKDPFPIDGMPARPAVATLSADLAVPSAVRPAALSQPEPAVATVPPRATIPTDDGLQPAVPADQPIDIAAAARPLRAEAISLLQLARDHLRGRRPVRDDPVAATMPAASKAPASAPTPAMADMVPVQIQPPHQAAPQVAMPSVSVMAPAVDLSASLSSQVVNMGVSGQWIDGLARDIAGLSAQGAQGRFEVNAGQLGAVRVDIRQGGEGASISLTVATEAAEQALRQDSDRLRLDAGLSALRIADVKIDRAPPVAEAARAESAGQQSPSQQQSSSQQQPGAGWQAGQGAGQFGGQSPGQYQGQGRWQGRENGGAGPKGGADAAVLNHGDVRGSGGDAVRARYA